MKGSRYIAAVLVAAALPGVGVNGPLGGQTTLTPMRMPDAAEGIQFVEIRSYALKPGSRQQFHRVFLEDALPMLRRWNLDVVAFGPSLHDADSYFLMRAYSSLADREQREDAFYGSDEWKQGPREAILACIDSYTTVVAALDGATVDGLRRSMRPEPAVKTVEEAMKTQTAAASDLATLVALNADYVRAVQTSDVKRFREILADDFLCSLSDGSLVDRDAFLKQTARPATIAHLQVHDVNVRLMGDFAIVHARTTFTMPDGRPGASRYTDVWARRDGRWLAVSAHVTRR
jgi:ketosteroid isomerase-like protein